MSFEQLDMENMKETILFFKNISWLYIMPTTKILFKGSLELIPTKWLSELMKLSNNELNDLVAKRQVNENCKLNDLRSFVEKCKKLNKLPSPKISLLPVRLPNKFIKHLSEKKRHEIFHLAEMVHDQCQKLNIQLIVDLGAGLGYVCQLLNHLYGYKILGLESRVERVEAVKNRQKNIFPESLASVKYVHCTISENSTVEIESILQQEFDQVNEIALIGLHACGDLSVHMSRIYKSMEKAKLLVLVSCCYHKMSLKNCEKEIEADDAGEHFNYFPLSNSLKCAIRESGEGTEKFFGRTFMRLACQETADRWLEMTEETHNEHAFYVLARAVLELYAAEHGLLLKKNVRKATRKSQCSDFERYLKDCANRYSFVKLDDTSESQGTVPWSEKLQNGVKCLWDLHKEKLKSVEIYTALQLLLQNAAESLVLTDRLLFLKENNFNACIIQTMNRSLSPRCYAIASNKLLTPMADST